MGRQTEGTSQMSKWLLIWLATVEVGLILTPMMTTSSQQAKRVMPRTGQMVGQYISLCLKHTIGIYSGYIETTLMIWEKKWQEGERIGGKEIP
jgi:hypothetical protein